MSRSIEKSSTSDANSIEMSNDDEVTSGLSTAPVSVPDPVIVPDADIPPSSASNSASRVASISYRPPPTERSV